MGQPTVSNQGAIIQDFLRALPKADLHLHLEGTTTVALLSKLAAKNGVSLKTPTHFSAGNFSVPAPNSAEEFGNFPDFSDFISLYVKISDCIRSEGDVAALVENMLQQAAAENCRMLEVYFSPSTYQLLGRKLEPLFDGLSAGQQLAKQAGVSLAWIFDIVRNASRDGMELIDLALAARRRGVNVKYIGLAGDERIGAAAQFARAFARARAEGFRLLAHAGETMGPESVRDVILHLAPERIGHGVRAAEDPRLLDELVRAGTVLEVCPWSNLQLNVTTKERHPLAALHAAGVALVLASDDPGLFNRSLTDNFLLAYEIGMSPESLAAIAARSVTLAA